MANQSDNEQLMLELTNRARLDPAGEAARFGIDLNEGLAPGTLASTARQPLAMNDFLLASADGHSTWMIATNTFSHTGSGGTSPGDRMANAGYVFTGSWTWGENIAWRGTSGAPDLTAMIITQHEDLFVDTGISGRGHRLNILNDAFREVGIGQESGVFNGYNSSMVTQDFAKSGSNAFISGVIYGDSNHDDFYSVGEGASGVIIAAGSSTTSGASGGYSLGVTAAAHSVTFSGGGIATAMTVEVDLSAGNVKLDVVDTTKILSSGTISLGSGAHDVTLLGVANINATGTASADVISGNKGANTLIGGAGADVIDGGAGSDAVSFASSASGVTVRLWNGTGSGGDAAGDTYTSIENVIGSSHSDILVGSFGTGNFLSGGLGDDYLFGLSGYDALYGGWGNDLLDGGSQGDRLDGSIGSDTVTYANSASGVTVKLYNGSASGGDATGDTLISIENLIGSSSADVLIGSYGQSNFLSGGVGNDYLFGLSGIDALYGGWGNDLLEGGGDADTLNGSIGIDTASYASSAGAVTVRLYNGTGSGNDAHGDTLVDIENLIGSGFDDALIGAYGVDNMLEGGAGADYLNGLTGSNTVSYASSASGVTIRLYNSTGTGGDATGDTLVGFDNVLGSNTGDTLIGSYGVGNIINGGGGGDHLFGLTGDDTFAFNDNFGNDVIHDFTDGAEFMDMSASSLSAADLRIEVVGSDTVVHFDQVDATISDTITLAGISSGIDASDFIF